MLDGALISEYDWAACFKTQSSRNKMRMMDGDGWAARLTGGQTNTDTARCGQRQLVT
jgi:hypothetical protein